MTTYHQTASRSIARAVIWDVDGTLIDSGPLHFDAWRDILQAEQFTLTRDRFHANFGQRNDAVLRDFLGAELGDAEIVRISTVKEMRYREMLRKRGVELLPGVRRLLTELRAAGWKQAIASSAPPENLDVIVDTLGLGSYFDAIVSGDDVQHGKPDPAIFLLAASRLAVAPEYCIVVEDAPAGVEGARRAGMRTIGVLFSHHHLDADIVTPSLDRLAPDAFDRLVPPL